ncbi:type III-A CRISPR-associated RAMP protein Csm4 [Diplocloster agilis]|uniref:type III-A CRISPR-associated RAMP protein Csm4 n=1 Tax=Diplocloster agilis TaxID=2850323 RepID=UPI0008216EE9|nr:type III-A CRISPR-associated RAMP protein Csm4 [Suonthocola fibrivorans]MCU6732981.1 type III-A CRISPR-associated RAMP protein Csm4 [Suonthocola fibrivorans]SCI71332.1 CRISPR type III-A/MTUBE-associated RAMP protein Csm4 [uncultured Clostridium sp.]
MNYYLYKIHFTGPVHFGDGADAKALEHTTISLCADTLFSALCHSASQMDGENKIPALVQPIIKGRLAFSDLFPYKKDTLYIPKPILPAKLTGDMVDASRRKQMKGLKFIPVTRLEEFWRGLQGERELHVEELAADFGTPWDIIKAAVRNDKDALPYTVSGFLFYEDCGLYGLVKYENQDDLNLVRRLLKNLEMDGLGGKISSGYGKFRLQEEKILDDSEKYQDGQSSFLKNSLTAKTKGLSLLLTTSLPRDDELDNSMQGAYYTLTRRGGYVLSAKYSDRFYKKKTQYFFAAGSVFTNRFLGDIYHVSQEKEHPVYRYSCPIFMEVKQ